MKHWELESNSKRDSKRFQRKQKSKQKKIQFEKDKQIRTLAMINSYDSKTKTVKLPAPKSLCIYDERHCEETLEYINKIKKYASAGLNVHISFPITNYISAGAMLLLLATVDDIRRKAKVNLTATRAAINKTECIFNQTGFTKVLGKTPQKTEAYADVEFWLNATGSVADPEIASNILEQIKNAIPKEKKLPFKGFVEAISNSVEHGYKHLNSSKYSRTSRWWAFGGISEGHVILLTCDLGAGIPVTLPREIQASWLDRALRYSGIDKSTDDAKLIKAATALRETATKQQNRGKGLHDMKKIVEKIPGSKLGIYSNKGLYGFQTSRKGKFSDKLKTYSNSINGTLIEWQMPVEKGNE